MRYQQISTVARAFFGIGAETAKVGRVPAAAQLVLTVKAVNNPSGEFGDSLQVGIQLVNEKSVDQVAEVLQPAIPSFGELALIALGIAVLIWLTFRVKAWFRDDDALAGRDTNLLQDLRELHRQGGLSDEEFRLIRTQVMGTPASGIRPPGAAAEIAEDVAPPASSGNEADPRP